MGSNEIVVGIGAAAQGMTGADSPTPVDVVLGLGPHHPSAHGVLRVRLTLEGDRIAVADPLIGHLHRGAEKLYEVRDYRQALVLANRHDWLAAFSNELGLALAVERMLGLEVPTRAVWLRTAYAELNRLLSHFAFLAPLTVGDPAAVGGSAAYGARESIQAVMDEATGGRIHFMANRIGGLREDVPDGWTQRVRAALDTATGALELTAGATVRNEEFQTRFGGLGAISADDVTTFALSGPVARASGVDLDLRRDAPYAAYGELGDSLRTVTRDAGDALARIECMVEQVSVSIALVAACLDHVEALTGAPINVPLPKVLRVPEGHTYIATESPLGANGYLLVSRGDKVPWRLKLRSASFNNVQVLSRALVGARVDDVVPILQSVFFVVGDLDK